MDTRMRESFFIQCKSLESFMSRLGYSAAESSKGILFVGQYSELNRYRVISFQNAVNLHNRSGEAVVECSLATIPGMNFVFPNYLFRQAEAAKIVEKAHLCLKSRQVYTSKQWVKFTNDTANIFFKALGDVVE